MKARHLIGSSIFGPQALQVVFRAFDGAWSEIAVQFSNDQRAIETPEGARPASNQGHLSLFGFPSASPTVFEDAT
jgi:hypothetical protein